jgi:hypothetical protein
MNISLHDQRWISTRLFKAEEWIAVSLFDERQDENSGKSVDRLYNMVILDKKSTSFTIYLPNTTNISRMVNVFEKTCS